MQNQQLSTGLTFDFVPEYLSKDIYNILPKYTRRHTHTYTHENTLINGGKRAAEIHLDFEFEIMQAERPFRNICLLSALRFFVIQQMTVIKNVSVYACVCVLIKYIIIVQIAHTTCGNCKASQI